MSYWFRGIEFPNKETADAWEAGNQREAVAMEYSRTHPLSHEEWIAECKRVREYGKKKQSRRQDAPVTPRRTDTANLKHQR